MSSLAPYAAPCVRACALRSALLRTEEWGAVSAERSADGVIAWLKERETLPEDVADVASAERAAHQAVIHCSEALLRFAEGALGALIGHFLHYYDLINLESVIHRVHAAVDIEQAQRLPYNTGVMGTFDDVLADVTNFAALSRMLQGTSFAAAYEAGLQRYYEDEDVTRLIEAIEVDFFASWVRSAEACGFGLSHPADSSALSAFLIERIIESTVRLKVYRQVEMSRVVEWFALVTEGNVLDACLEAANASNEDEAALALARLLLPQGFVAGIGEGDRDSGTVLSQLRVAVLRRALKAGRGITFCSDFLASVLVLHVYQAMELTVLLESKETGIMEIPLAYGEIAA